MILSHVAAATLVAAALASAPAALAPAPVQAGTVCTVTDPRLDEVSGLVLDGDGYVAMNDSKFGEKKLTLYRVDGRCAVSGTIGDSGYDPFDTEDLARTPDGVLWVADIGDNNRSRAQPAILRLPPGARHGVKYTLHYPDGPHDAEALLMQPDGRAVVVTKELSGVARVFVTARALSGPAATLELSDVGQVTIAPTTTKGGPLEGSTIVTTLVTGAAVAPDGERVVLRTYTDAYEWDVRSGAIATALTTGEPRRTALPGEPQGESIAYTADGAGFVTASEGIGQPLRRWVPAPRTARSPSASAGERSATGSGGDAGSSWLPVLVGAGLAGGAVACVVLAAAGIAAIRRRRSRPRL